MSDSYSITRPEQRLSDLGLQLRVLVRRESASRREIGLLLLEVRALLPHGEFLPWLEEIRDHHTVHGSTGVGRITSDNPRSEDPRRIADEIVAGMAGATHELILDRREAIRHALESSGERDVVLLAGKGHETYQIRGAEKFDFDERLVITELLAEMGARR